MSIAESIVRIASDEMEKHGLHKLLLVRVRYGAMSNVVADSLSFCFEAMTLNTPHAEARLELEELPTRIQVASATLSGLNEKTMWDSLQLVKQVTFLTTQYALHILTTHDATRHFKALPRSHGKEKMPAFDHNTG